MLLRIVRKSLREHALSTCITSISIALACGLLLSIWVIKEQARSTFTQMNAGFDAVLGARSSKLQLVLNSIFHLEASPANIEWSDYLEMKKNPAVALAGLRGRPGGDFHLASQELLDSRSQRSVSGDAREHLPRLAGVGVARHGRVRLLPSRLTREVTSHPLCFVLVLLLVLVIECR